MPERPKIAFVVQRYGTEISGGAEQHCRMIAERLCKDYTVEVWTTCAIDYMTWENSYSEGSDWINGVKVTRFKVKKPRNVSKFNRLSEKIFSHPTPNWQDSMKWIEEQGPASTDLITHIESEGKAVDAIFFFTYLYFPTFYGIQIHPDKSILVPTAHDEPPIYLPPYRNVFCSPKAIIYNAQEEKQFVQGLFKNQMIQSTTAGIGIELTSVPESIVTKVMSRIVEQFKFNSDNYILYLGRIDPSKGCDQLFENFLEFCERGVSGNDFPDLVLAGSVHMEIPRHKHIHHVGFINDEEKYSLLKRAKLLILPSERESFSMSTLEAMSVGTPVLVNGNCTVLEGHCLRSNGGLSYHNRYEFQRALSFLLDQSELTKRIGQQGYQYVQQYYRWDTVIEHYKEMIRYVASE